MPAMRIVPIQEAHIAGFRACLDAVARERRYIGFVAAPPLPDVRHHVLESLAQGDIRLVALDGDTVIGWIDITRSTLEGFTHKGRLGMGIMQGYRRQGLGTRLMQAALAAARQEGLERIELDVYASNSGAIRLYERFNFVIEGRKRNARKLDGVYDDIICMALLLREETS